MDLDAPPSARVLRGAAPLAPFPFGVLVETEPEPAELAPFVPFESLLSAEPGTPSPTPPPLLAPDAAYREGLDTGRAERRDELEALQATVAQLTADLADATTALDDKAAAAAATAEQLAEIWREAVRQAEPDLCTLALEAAEGVLDAPLSPVQRAALDHAIAQAVDALAADGPLAVTLHPVDLLHLRETGLVDSLTGAHPALRWEPDEALAQGDWAVSTSEAAVRRTRAAMMTSLRARLGLGTH